MPDIGPNRPDAETSSAVRLSDGSPSGRLDGGRGLRGRLDVWAVISGVVIGALSLLLTIALQPPPVLVRFMLLVLTVAAVGWIFMPRSWQVAIAALVAALLAIITAVVFVRPSLLQHKPERVTVTVPAPTVTATIAPSPSSASSPPINTVFQITTPATAVPLCTRVYGTGPIPPGQDLWVVLQTPDGDYYPLAKAVPDNFSGEWATALIGIGSSGTKEGTPFVVLTVLVDADTSTYFAYILNPGVSFAPILPPHTTLVAKATFVRRFDTRDC